MTEVLKPSTQAMSRQGICFALMAAALFGAGTPVSKILLGKINPILLAGLLYLGSGGGLAVCRLIRPRAKSTNDEAGLTLGDLPWLGGAIISGGVAGPILLMIGLAITPASSASLLLNLEVVLTAVLAWFVFKENYDCRIVLGMIAIAAGGVLLSPEGQHELGGSWGSLAITGACLAWAIDNNLSRRVSGSDPIQIVVVKGLIAGVMNVIIAFISGAKVPSALIISTACVVGLLSYGVSLTLFVLALRHLGTARTGAYFSVAPFVGAALSILLLGDRLTINFFAAAAMMGLGVWLHLSERHRHEHQHTEIEHEHAHLHDEHHRHNHGEPVAAAVPHNHAHRHAELLHSHPHYPDIHHRHKH